MEMKKKILLRQMNKVFDNGEDIDNIKIAFTTFIVSVVSGFLLTLMISSLFHQNSNEYDADDGYLHKISHTHRDQNTEIADRLYRNVRILCLVTTFVNHKTKAKFIKETWGSRCNHIIFLSPKSIDSFETLVMPGAKEGRSYLWHSIREGLKYVHVKYMNKFDFVIKTDDNTYVVMENLRYLLETESPNEPKAFGFKYKDQDVVYLSSVQILSRETVKRFALKAYPDESLCRTGEIWDSDIELGRCLKNIGVEFGETLDSEGKERVFPFSPRHHMLPETMVKGKNNSYVAKAMRRKDGLGSLSDYSVSFHSLYEHSQILFEYLIYHLRPYGIIYKYTEENQQ
ncbi:C1GALT1.2 family protein [Megaselia abdita]